MNKDLIYKILFGLGLLICVFFIGRCNSPKEYKTIKVEVPAKAGSSPLIINSKPIVTFKDSIIYKNNKIVTENPINKKLMDEYIELEKRYTGIELETKRLNMMLNATQKRTYIVPFEDQYLNIEGTMEVQGELLSTKYNYNIKARTIEKEIEIPKSKLNLYSGVQISNNIKLDNFNFSPTLGLQNSKGDIILGSYGILDESIQVGYLFKF